MECIRASFLLLSVWSSQRLVIDLNRMKIKRTMQEWQAADKARVERKNMMLVRKEPATELESGIDR